MHTVTISEVFKNGHKGSGWVRGFSADVEPRVSLDHERVAEVLVTPNTGQYEGVEVDEYFFSDYVLAQGGLRTLIVGATPQGALGFGELTSEVHAEARTAFTQRIGFLLEEQGIEYTIEGVVNETA